MIVRSALLGDASAIVALEQALFGADAWSSASVTGELSGADRVAAVAEDEGSVCGYAVTMRAGDVVDLQRVGVDPAYRRQGVASALLDRLFERAAAAGAQWVMLEVSADNRPALACYAEAGFVEVDRRRRYYRDGSDAVVMSATTPV